MLFVRITRKKMTEALQIELKPSYQPHDVMAERLEVLEQETKQLHEAIKRLQHEKAHLDRQLTGILYRYQELRMRSNNRDNSGSAVIGILVLVVAFVLLFYGMGIFDFSIPSSVDYKHYVVERMW